VKYAYYPGCSLEKTQRGYDASVRNVFKRLGQELVEIDDWNCCGATVYMSVKETVAFAVSARNLALAETMGLDVIAPCSSCFTVLAKTNRVMQELPGMYADVNRALAEGNLKYSARTAVRHPLEVLVNDVGIGAIQGTQERSLAGLRVAPYYGCQIVRPDKGFDDHENPMMMDRLFHSCGAQIAYYPMKLRCCGGMLMTTFADTALKLTRDLLACAEEHEADVLVTTCPLCHFNLEVYQAEVNRMFKTKFSIPILYFTQLLGIALGLDPESLGLDERFVPLGSKLVSLMEVQHA
jgi:heterodisulfide reductase subunit B2